MEGEEASWHLLGGKSQPAHGGERGTLLPWLCPWAGCGAWILPLWGYQQTSPPTGDDDGTTLQFKPEFRRCEKREIEITTEELLDELLCGEQSSQAGAGLHGTRKAAQAEMLKTAISVWACCPNGQTEKWEKGNDSGARKEPKNDICPASGSCQILKFLGVKTNTNTGKIRLDFHELMPVHKTCLRIPLWDTRVLGNQI